MKLSYTDYDAVLFDLDGVLTLTMKIHALCWKDMFDTFLKERADRLGQAFRPFEIADDYKPFVDGKLRYDGVRSFLQSRGISLPEGTPDDSPDAPTVCGLGNRKDRMVNAMIASDGVEVISGSIATVHRVRARGLLTAVVSASKNCETVLKATGIIDLFDTIVDGTVAARLGLPGKPSPHTYLQAARELGVEPARAIVVEDALSGVQAGRAGGFGLVIGIDHYDDKGALLQGGADIVVKDLLEVF